MYNSGKPEKKEYYSYMTPNFIILEYVYDDDNHNRDNEIVHFIAWLVGRICSFEIW